jgi:hypothetical protein
MEELQLVLRLGSPWPILHGEYPGRATPKAAAWEKRKADGELK